MGSGRWPWPGSWRSWPGPTWPPPSAPWSTTTWPGPWPPAATRSLVADLLPRLVRGETLGAFLLTEPEVGSDAAKISCASRRDGDEWVIDGSKAWVTNASHAGALNLYAQTDPSLGHRGIVSIVVDPEAPGVTRTEPYELMGAHAMGTGGFEFDGVRAPVADTLVPVGQAFAAAMAGIDLARVLVGAMCCGSCWPAPSRWPWPPPPSARSSGQPGGRQAGRPVDAGRRAATDLEAIRLLTFRAARLLQDGDDATLMAAHAKKLLAVNGTQSVEALHRELGRVVWEHCGMERTADGLREGMQKVRDLRERFWSDVRVLGSPETVNQDLEKAGRVADFMEFAEVMMNDGLIRDESCGGHFRAEHQTEEGEAKRDDENFSHVTAWEYTGDGELPTEHREPLSFEEVKLTTRSYK